MYNEQAFLNWIRELPIDFIQYLYTNYRLNVEIGPQLDSVMGSSGTDTLYVGPLGPPPPPPLPPKPVATGQHEPIRNDEIANLGKSLGLSTFEISKLIDNRIT